MAFSILQRRTKTILQKQPIEVGHVVEARVKADFGDGLLRIQKQFAGKSHPQIDQELLEAMVGVFAKKMAKGRIAHVDQASHIGYFHEVVGKIFQNIGIHNLNAATVGF